MSINANKKLKKNSERVKSIEKGLPKDRQRANSKPKKNFI